MNQDFNQSVCYRIDDIDWEPSPAAGVWRKKLDRQNAESGRATSVVKYEAGSSFRSHTHDGGEEILVMEGVFSDESGDYPKGWYFRNPPGTSHAPSSLPGCEIFVKLCHFQRDDCEQVALSIDDPEWLQDKNGNTYKPLHSYKNETTAIYSLKPQQQLKIDTGVEREIFVFTGVVVFDSERFASPSWLRLAKNDPRVIEAEKNCMLLVKTGHLSHFED